MRRNDRERIGFLDEAGKKRRGKKKEKGKRKEKKSLRFMCDVLLMYTM